MAEELARAFVTIVPDFSKFDSELQAKLKPAATAIEQAFAGAQVGSASGLTGIVTQANQAAAAVKRLGTEGVAATKGLTEGFGASAFALQRLGNALTRFISAPTLGLLKSSVSTVSDLTEATQASIPAFNDSAAQVQHWAQTLDTSFGLTQKTALTTANTFGLLFGNIGLTNTAASQLAETLTQRAADVGSLFNINSVKVAQDFTSAIEGQSRTVRKYGVLLSESAVKQEAYNSGIAKAGTELTDAQKIQARVNIILAQTSKAQGDAARTVGTFAGQIRQLRPEIEKLQTNIGQALLPAATIALHIFEGLVDTFNSLPGPLRDLVVLTGVFAAALGPAILITAQFANAIRILQAVELSGLLTKLPILGESFVAYSAGASKAEAATIALNTALTKLGPLALGGAAITGLVLAFRSFSDEMNKAAGTTKQSTDSIKSSLDSLGETGGKFQSNFTDKVIKGLDFAFSDSNKDKVGRFTENLAKPFGSLFGITTKLESSNDIIKKTRDSLIALADVDLNKAIDQTFALQNALEAEGVPLEQINRLLGPVRAKIDQVRISQDAQTNSTENQTAALKDQVSFLQDLLNITQSISSDAQNVDSAQTARNKALREYNDLLKTNGIDLQDIAQKTTALAEAEEKIADKRQAVIDRNNDLEAANRTLANSTQDLADAQQKLNDLLAPATPDELAQANDKVTAAQLRLNRANRDAANALKELNKLNGTQLNLHGLSLDQLRSTLANVRASLDASNRQDEADNARAEAIDKVTETHIDQRDAIRGLADAQKDLNDLENKGKIDTPAIVAARNQIRDAEDRLKNARQGVLNATTAIQKAEREVLDAIRDEQTARDNLAKAQAGDPDFNQKLAEKKQAVTDATNRLHDAQRQQAIDLATLHTLQDTNLSDDERKKKILEDTLDIYKKFGDLPPQVQDILNKVFPDTTIIAGQVNIGAIAPQGPIGALPGLKAIPTLPFEEGGLITRPTQAIMGEKFRPELILPLADPARSWELLAPHLPKISKGAMVKPQSVAMPEVVIPTIKEAIRTVSSGSGEIHSGSDHFNRDLLLVMQSMDEKLAKLVEADPSVSVTMQQATNEQLLIRKMKREVEKMLAERRR